MKTESFRFGSVCSGIEAASVALHPLGWSAAWLAEIEPFPSAVLAYRFPDVPNLGDMTAIADRVLAGEIEAPDALIGGTPCQAFSVAGLRGGLSDARGQLSLAYVELANAIDTTRLARGDRPAVIWWENVPGVLSSKDNAFGCFLAGLAGESSELKPPGGKWADAGCVFGPQRTVAWRVLDAQYFELAQRRRRVFVVASADPGFDPVSVLLEFEGVRRDSPPSRGAGEEVTGTLSARTDGGGGLGTDFECAGGLQPSRVTVMAHGQGGAEISEDRCPTLTCNHEAPIAAYSVRTANTSSNGWGVQEEVTHTLDATQGPAVCYAFQPRIGRNGRGDMGDVVNALTATAGETGKGDAAPCVATAHAVCITGDITHALKAEGFDASEDGTGRGQPIVACAFQERGRADGRSLEIGGDVAYALTAPAGGGRAQERNVLVGTAVRRLLPIECERLQGFPDGWTRIPIRRYAKKTVTKARPEDQWELIDGAWWLMAADGPRYKALGNSMATNVMHWIGRRITAELQRLSDGR